MKLVCQDCRFGKKVSDESIKYCPQCGSENIRISLDSGVVEQRPTPKVSKVDRHPGKKVTKAGGYFLVIAILTLMINFIMPTSSSYAFILFIFPVQIVIGLVLLVVGLIISARSKSEEFP